MENKNINPWLHLWIRPRKTLRSILTSDPKYLVMWLAVVGGIISFLTFGAFGWWPPKSWLHVALILVTLIVLGAIFGLIHLYFSGWLLKLTGSWIGGKGSFSDLKCAVGWSNYPFIIANLIALLGLYFSKNIWLKSLFGLINLILLIWGLIIFFKLISEAHQFSVWKGILAFLIALVLVFVVLMLVALLVPLISPLFQ